MIKMIMTALCVLLSLPAFAQSPPQMSAADMAVLQSKPQTFEQSHHRAYLEFQAISAMKAHGMTDAQARAKLNDLESGKKP